MINKVFQKIRNKVADGYYAINNSAGCWCPVCEQGFRRFLSRAIGNNFDRDDCECPHCGCSERHRLAWLVLNQKTDFFSSQPRKMLHVAPEGFFLSKFQEAIGEGYITADLMNPKVMVKMDITDIQYPEESFDIVYCSHVLEHVSDDRKAMREFARVLKKDGWAFLQVPLFLEKTEEDPTITDPAERLRRFGQEDHLRLYGPDFVDRLQEAGFVVKMYKASDVASPEEIKRMGLFNRETGEVYICTRG
ncbi:MAG: class I SAM-dependent methyltransferase [Armatimonadaceae bacterium]